MGPPESRFVIGAPRDRYPSYTSPRSPRVGGTLGSNYDPAYAQRVHAQAAQRRLERELFTIAVMEERDRAKQGKRRPRSSPRSSSESPRENDASGEKPDADEEPQRKQQADTKADEQTAADSRDDGVDAAADGSDAKDNSKAPDADPAADKKKQEEKEQRRKQRAERRQRRREQAKQTKRLAAQPKPPKTPPNCAPRPAKVKRIDDATFVERFNAAPQRSLSARRSNLMRKYTPALSHKPQINEMPSQHDDGESEEREATVDWELVADRLYRAEVSKREHHMEKLLEKFKPAPPKSARVHDSDIADRMYVRGVERERNAVRKAVDKEEKREAAVRPHTGRKLDEERWRERLNAGFASPRGAAASP